MSHYSLLILVENKGQSEDELLAAAVALANVYDTEVNDEGHFDYGDILGRIPSEEWHEVFLSDVGRICRAAITPDGAWHDGPWIMSDRDPVHKKRMDEWVTTLQNLLHQHADAAAFIADMHF